MFKVRGLKLKHRTPNTEHRTSSPPINGSGFFQAPDWVIDADLTVYEMGTLVYLYRVCGKRRKPFPGVKTIADNIGVGERTVSRSIAFLKKKSVRIGDKNYPMLEVVHRYGKDGKRISSEYTLPPIIKRVQFVTETKDKPPHRPLVEGGQTASQAVSKPPHRRLVEGLLTACEAEEGQQQSGSGEGQQEEGQQQGEVVVPFEDVPEPERDPEEEGKTDMEKQGIDVIQELIDCGVDKKVAIQLSYQFPDDRIRSQIALFKTTVERRAKKGGIENPPGPGWLVRSIEGNWKPKKKPRNETRLPVYHIRQNGDRIEHNGDPRWLGWGGSDGNYIQYFRPVKDVKKLNQLNDPFPGDKTAIRFSDYPPLKWERVGSVTFVNGEREE